VRFRFRLNRDTTTPDFDVAMKEGKDRRQRRTRLRAQDLKVSSRSDR
jgi:hypothetical protein